MRAAHLYVYPIKSCGGVEVERLRLDAAGVENDRVFVLVGEDGRHITQREAPQLAAVRTTIEREDVRVATPGGREIVLPRGGDNGPLTDVRVHRDGCRGFDQGDAAADFFGGYLQMPCRLLHVSVENPRLRHPEGVLHPFPVSFADGYPLLLISRASLDDLNARLAEPVGIERFRPNIVVEGSEAYAEDGWSRIVIGGMTLEGAKRCVRCIVTTTDQERGRRHPRQEPLRTLATYRTDATLGGPVFGRNSSTEPPAASTGTPGSTWRDRSRAPSTEHRAAGWRVVHMTESQTNPNHPRRLDVVVLLVHDDDALGIHEAVGHEARHRRRDRDPVEKARSGRASMSRSSRPCSSRSSRQCPPGCGRASLGVMGIRQSPGRAARRSAGSSQVIGGVVGGIGTALEEESVLDHAFGRFMTRNLADYHVPVAPTCTTST